MITYDELRKTMATARTYRRFDASRPVSSDQLTQLVEVIRYCPSGRNLQPLRYRPVTATNELNDIFTTLKWAGYYTEWNGPDVHERPTAYLVQCLDTRLTENQMCDDGLQLEAITIAAASMGLGTCIIKSFNAATVSSALKLPDYMKPLYVVALGYPAERVAIVDTDGSLDADIKYYHDAQGTHCVPKRPLEELIIH